MKTYICAKVSDPETERTVRKFPFKRAHSFTANFVKFLYANWTYGTVTAFDTANTLRSTSAWDCRVISALTTAGIMIGSGTNRPALTDYCMQTQLTTNIVHSGTVLFLHSPNASAMELILARMFTNNTGSLLTINEVGLAGMFGNNLWPILLDRTLYAATCPNGMAITLTYKMAIRV